MKASRFGIRMLFRIAVILVVALACLVLAQVSFTNVTAGELARKEASIRSEVNYLCLQLESLGNRADAFESITDSLEVNSQELESEFPEDYRLLSDPVGDVLTGYTLAETGTVAVIADGVVVASDDARVPIGGDVHELLGDEVCGAIEASLENGQLQRIPYRGVFDEPGGAGAYGDGDDEAYLLAARQGDYDVVIVEPLSMVFSERRSILGRELFAAFITLLVAGGIVDRLLSLVVARRIDKTNESLARITSGDLETRVEEKGTREFISLASGINVTVEALQGWIAEAETRMDSELAAARAIQESALPRTFPPYPEIPSFDVYATMDAAREVGGDFYDFFLIGDGGPDSGKLAFLIADVSGKGVPAALFMMKAKAQVRRELQSGLGLAEAIGNANNELADGNDSCMFVTMWVGVLDYGTGNVEYVNAGHNPPLLRQQGSDWCWLKGRSGLPLGLSANLPYESRSLECGTDASFLLYTDGVTEAMSEDDVMYGEKRLEAVVNASSDVAPEALVEAVRSDVAAFAKGAEQSDDITILVLGIGAPSGMSQ